MKKIFSILILLFCFFLSFTLRGNNLNGSEVINIKDRFFFVVPNSWTSNDTTNLGKLNFICNNKDTIFYDNNWGAQSLIHYVEEVPADVIALKEPMLPAMFPIATPRRGHIMSDDDYDLIMQEYQENKDSIEDAFWEKRQELMKVWDLQNDSIAVIQKERDVARDDRIKLRYQIEKKMKNAIIDSLIIKKQSSVNVQINGLIDFQFAITTGKREKKMTFIFSGQGIREESLSSFLDLISSIYFIRKEE